MIEVEVAQDSSNQDQDKKFAFSFLLFGLVYEFSEIMKWNFFFLLVQKSQFMRQNIIQHPQMDALKKSNDHIFI